MQGLDFSRVMFRPQPHQRQYLETLATRYNSATMTEFWHSFLDDLLRWDVGGTGQRTNSGGSPSDGSSDGTTRYFTPIKRDQEGERWDVAKRERSPRSDISRLPELYAQIRERDEVITGQQWILFNLANENQMLRSKVRYLQQQYQMYNQNMIGDTFEIKRKEPLDVVKMWTEGAEMLKKYRQALGGL